MTPRTAVEREPRASDTALARAFEFLGKRWNGMILGTLGAGSGGFADLRRSLGISDSMLADRLGELTRAGLVERTVDDGPPLSVTYALTDAGAAVLPALTALTEWASANLTDERCAGHR